MIAYHGTSPENAAKILVEGFHADSWFALKPIDALIGGPCILLVAGFDPDKWPRNEIDPSELSWQMHHPEPISVERVYGRRGTALTAWLAAANEAL